MAITKIIGAIHPPSKGGKHKVLKNTIDYISDPEKTENGRLVGSLGCFTDNALQVMMETQRRYDLANGNQFGKHERLGYHFTISFSPEEEVSLELALQVMQEFSETLLGKQHEAVYSVHTDKEHLHGHLCFNSVNFETLRKFRYEKGDWAKIIQPITDKICQKYGLHTLEMDTGKTIAEYAREQEEKERKAYLSRIRKQEQNILKKHGYHKDVEKEYNWNDHLRLLLDDIVLHSQSMEEFYQQLREKGFSVKEGTSQKYGAYIGLKAPGMEIHRRTYQLGKEYTLENLEKRIAMVNKPLPSYQLPEDSILIIPIRHFMKVKRKRNLSPEMKRYFARLYRLGVRPRSARLTYQDVKETRRKAEEMQRRLEMVLKYHIGSKYDADTAVMECQRDYLQAKADFDQVKQKHADYDFMLKSYRWYLKLKKQSEQYLEMNPEVQEKLLEAKYAFQKYGFTEQEVEKYIVEKRIELKEVTKLRQEAEKQLRIAEDIAKEYANEMERSEMEHLNSEEERFYDSISETDELSMEERQKRAERRRI